MRTALPLLLALAACKRAPTPAPPRPAAPAVQAPTERPAGPRPTTAPVVILVTLDGVRPKEFFGHADPTLCGEAPARGTPECTRQGYLFDRTLADHATRGFLWGAPESNTEANAANAALLSLPAYQTIFTGAPTACADNNCPRVASETLGERLVREGHFARDDAAFFASWEAMPRAVERAPGATLCNAGFAPASDPAANQGELTAINERQLADRPPWQGARGDWWTMVHALRHLRDHRPRFLYIGLNDADEWAHRGDYRQYLGSLRLYDEWIGRLLTMLDGMGDYGQRATVFLTTDHGRGDGARWRDHGPDTPEARAVFLLAIPPGDPARRTVRTRAVTHLDLRPTVEAIFGLAPVACPGCGHPIAEVVEAARAPGAAP